MAYLRCFRCHILLCASDLFLGQIHQDWWAVHQSVRVYAQLHCAQYLYRCCSVSTADSKYVETADKAGEEVCYSWSLLVGRVVSSLLPYVFAANPQRSSLVLYRPLNDRSIFLHQPYISIALTTANATCFPTKSVCVAAIVRIFFINTIHWSDAPYTFVDLGIWLNVECNIGIVSACLPVLPALRPLLKKVRRSVFSSNGSISFQDYLDSTMSERLNNVGTARVKRVDEGSEMSSFELRTPKASPLAGMGPDHEAQRVNLPD